MRRHLGLRIGWQILVILCAATLAQASGSASIAKTSRLPAHLPSGAIGRDVVVNDEAQLEARLLVSSGPERHVGVLFDLAPGWHLYWRNPGDTGLAPHLDLEVPTHTTGPVDWPAPEVFEEADGLFTTFGYSERVLISVPIRPEAGEAAPANDELVHANVRALVCRSECVPATFSLTTPFDPKLSGEDQTRVDRLFADAIDQVPVSIDRLGLDVKAHWTSAAPVEDEIVGIEIALVGCATGMGTCEVSLPNNVSVPFLPFEDLSLELTELTTVPSSLSEGGRKIEMRAQRIEAGKDHLSGLVLVEDRDGQIHPVSISAPILEKTTQPAMPSTLGATSETLGSWLQIFALALLGGLILNAMPCVLPVLAIKVVAIADLGDKNPRDVRIQGLAYTGGVLASMSILAAVVVSLRSAGHSVGWGFQFQEPLFVASISAVLVAFALNLFGVFEIDFGQGRLAEVGTSGSMTRRSIFEGLLAVVLATPCTAPFLGTAVGFAFAASGFSILLIFLAIGLGLALPFLAVSFQPGLARFIPRSGPWMLKLRAGLGFCLLATVVWLLWIAGQTGGTHAIIGLASVLLLLGFMLWAFGQSQPLSSRWLARASAVAIAGVTLAGLNLIEFDETRGIESTPILEQDARWAPYSEEAVAASLADGRPAFVVFTADWCITCKLNESTVLNRASIQAAFEADDYALFKADWTRRDEKIRATLARFGRAGVPLYLVYSPDTPDAPETLSELLSQADVRAALARSAPTDRG